MHSFLNEGIQLMKLRVKFVCSSAQISLLVIERESDIDYAHGYAEVVNVY